jgi:hypothetical protein
VGAVGHALTIGGAEVTIHGWQDWPSPQRPVAGDHFVAVSITVLAGADLTLSIDSITLTDDTDASFVPVVEGAKPELRLPTTIHKGASVAGLVTFEIPYGGNYVLLLGTAGGPDGIVALPVPAPAPTQTASTSVRPTRSAAASPARPRATP